MPVTLPIQRVTLTMVHTAPDKRRVLAPKRTSILAGTSLAAAQAFADAIAQSWRRHHAQLAARPKGDGMLAGLAPGTRVAPKVERDYRGKPLHRPTARDIYRASKLHRHSKRCLVRTADPRDAGWLTCKAAPTWPGLHLHEHRTKRGRVFLVAHLREIPCPFTVTPEGGQS